MIEKIDDNYDKVSGLRFNLLEFAKNFTINFVLAFTAFKVQHYYTDIGFGIINRCIKNGNFSMRLVDARRLRTCFVTTIIQRTMIRK